MARLIVEAASDEKHDIQTPGLRVCVSVSRADTGQPVTGLTDKNFRITNINYPVALPESTPEQAVARDWVVSVLEKTWDPSDKEPSGVYDVRVNFPFDFHLVVHSFTAGETYAFGLQVRTFPSRGHGPGGQGGINLPGDPVDFGQTVVSLVSSEQEEL